MEKPVNQVSRGSTTFIQADKTSFRELVQRLTGPSTDCDRQTSITPPTNEATNDGAAVKVTGIKRQTSRLLERREYTRSKLEIVKPGLTQTGLHLTDRVTSPSQSGNFAFTTSPLGTPSKALLNLSISGKEDDEEEAKSVVLSDQDREEEEKAIQERRFYLHPSPRSRQGNVEPELLPLFPLTSPKETHQY
ncbi:VQ motif-containing protein 31-like [Telopea speciosissima]|uniref:VQ motif-containing protein 31-like n=1 Tax=Telopea speciosissima TaxID=54955 RepID=UPI001CC4856E|nr:VQ motif-containing protein 31-like [Telopea speciosissima]